MEEKENEKVEFNVRSYYYPFDDVSFALTTEIEIKGSENTSIQQKHIIIVLDNSGSMSGSPIAQAKEAISNLAKTLKNNSMDNISFIVFNSNAVSHECQNLTLDNILKVINNVSACGGTNFCITFDEIFKGIKKRGKEDVVIIFFTDGQDGSRNELDKRLIDLPKSFANETSSTAVHTIGLGSGHDANLLGKMTLAGTVQGTFQYVKESKEIEAATQVITGLLGGVSLVASIKHGDTLQKINLREEAESQYKATILVQKNELASPLQLHLKMGKRETSITLDPVERSEIDVTTKIDITTGVISTQLIELGSIVTNPNTSKEVLDEVKVKVTKFDATLDGLQAEVFKMKTISRKQLMPLILEAKDLIGKFLELLTSAMTKTLTNDKIASLNALAYKGITKRGLQRKLDKRVQDNVSLFEKLEAEVTQKVASIDFTKLREKYQKEAEELGNCALTCNNWIDLLEDGDCICITLDVVRSQAAIADPSQVVIKTINQSLLGAEAFLDSVIYSVGKTEMAHGGFDKAAEGSIVLGQARENITGVLPLYICSEHWDIARNKMKSIMGWMTTLDVLGYSYSQIKTIPFLILAKAAQDLSTEFLRKQYQLIFETCCQIYKEASRPNIENRLSVEVCDWYKKYNTEPNVRTVDVIPSNRAFLSYLLCALECKDIETLDKDYVDKFFKNVVEEEMRRKQFGSLRNMEEKEKVQTLFECLSVDRKKYIMDHVDAFEDEQRRIREESKKNQNNSHIALKIINILTSRGETVEDSSVKPDGTQPSTQTVTNTSQTTIPEKPKLPDPTDWDGKLPQTLPPRALKLIEETEKLFQYEALPLLSFKPLFGVGGIPVRLTEIGLETNEQVLALILQNILQSKNSDRRQAITDGNYFNPWEQAEQFLKKTFVKIVTDDKNTRINEIVTRMAKQDANNIASVFADTDNIYEAAGVVYGTLHGTVNFPALFTCLQQQACPLAIEKMKMILSGEFRGISLFMDKRPNQEAPLPWVPSKKNMFRLWQRNHNLMTPDEWQQTFVTARSGYFTLVERIYFGGDGNSTTTEKK